MSNDNLQQVKDLDLLLIMKDSGIDVRKAKFSHIKCPFKAHGATGATPSFKYYEETNSFFCWGCGASGTTIDFVMQFFNFPFPDAVEYLGRKYELHLKEAFSRRFIVNKSSDKTNYFLDLVKGVRDLLNSKPSDNMIIDFIQRVLFCERHGSI